MVAIVESDLEILVRLNLPILGAMVAAEEREVGQASSHDVMKVKRR